MTKSQLNTFFSHFNLEKDYSDNSIRELKKLLLLELKSSTDDLVHIDGKSWSRNDILTFFDQPLNVEFDVEAFYEKYPWVKCISDPEKLLFDVTEDFFLYDDLEFVTFRNVEAIKYEIGFIREIRNCMRTHEDTGVSNMLNYIGCFRLQFRFEVLDLLRSMMYTRLNTALADIQSSKSTYKGDFIVFMKYQGYYDVLAQLGEHDLKLTYLNLKVLGLGMLGGTYETLIEIYHKQKHLPFSLEGEEFLRQIHKNLIKVKIRNEQGSGVWSGLGKLAIWILIILVYMTLHLFMSK